MFGAITKQLINMTLIASSLSYWICLFIAMFSIILYIIGFKKSGKFITLSLVIYVFFEGIKNAFK